MILMPIVFTVVLAMGFKIRLSADLIKGNSDELLSR